MHFLWYAVLTLPHVVCIMWCTVCNVPSVVHNVQCGTNSGKSIGVVYKKKIPRANQTFLKGAALRESLLAKF